MIYLFDDEIIHIKQWRIVQGMRTIQWLEVERNWYIWNLVSGVPNLLIQSGGDKPYNNLNIYFSEQGIIT